MAINDIATPEVEDLSPAEIEQVDGGVAPLVWAGVILAVHAVNYAMIYDELSHR